MASGSTGSMVDETALVAFDEETPDSWATIAHAAFAGKNTSEEEVRHVHHYDLIVADVGPIEQELPRPMTSDVCAPAPQRRGSPWSSMEAEKTLSPEKMTAEEDDRLYLEIVKKARHNGVALTAASAESQALTMRYSTVLSREEQLEFETALAAVVDYEGPDRWERVAQALPWGMTAEKAERRHDDLVHDVIHILEGRAPFPFCVDDYSEEDGSDVYAEENMNK